MVETNDSIVERGHERVHRHQYSGIEGDPMVSRRVFREWLGDRDDWASVGYF